MIHLAASLMQMRPQGSCICRLMPVKCMERMLTKSGKAGGCFTWSELAFVLDPFKMLCSVRYESKIQVWTMRQKSCLGEDDDTVMLQWGDEMSRWCIESLHAVAAILLRCTDIPAICPAYWQQHMHLQGPASIVALTGWQ